MVGGGHAWLLGGMHGCWRVFGWQGVCVVKVGMHGEGGMCGEGGVCMVRGHVWQGGMHGKVGHVWQSGGMCGKGGACMGYDEI